MAKILKWFAILQTFSCISSFRNQFYTKEDILRKREEVRKIFQHAYDGYLNYASGYDELRPLTCDGINTWGSYSLTLIDALDTLAVMGNFTEFRRVVQYLVENSNFDSDINVSVFETNIRVVGGLLSAHLMSRRAGVDLEPGWPCNGPLLRMAEDVARRLLPAFDTKTGMPYGTVNLRYGVPPGETPVTCTAGVGTFLVEFGSLSRLTGDPIYEEVALNAIYSLWKYRSPIGLFGNHIDVQTGRWTAQDSGIGAGVDSYFEYLVKGAILLNRSDLLEMFHESRQAIDKYMRKEDWYVWVSMTKAQITLPVFQSLEAFWPGILSAIGDIEAATKTFAKYHSVWKQYGFLPEFYNIPNLEATANRESYPLRPEIIESAMFLYRATKDQYYLEFGDDMLTSIQHSARTECGYATIKNVRTHERENRMESFFLAETTKYLYLLFDPDNFIHNDGSQGTWFETTNGNCIIEGGNYIFNTEAHPIDPSALRCCHDAKNFDIFEDFNIDDYKGELLDMKTRKLLIEEREEINKKFECPKIVPRNANITVDIEFVTEVEANFSDTEKLLSQLTKEQSKKQIEKMPEERKEFTERTWNESEKQNIYTHNSEIQNEKKNDSSDIANILKSLMKKVVLKNKIFKSKETSDRVINEYTSFDNLYELFVTKEKINVSKNLLNELEVYYSSLPRDENTIDVGSLFQIVCEILELAKNNITKYNFEGNSHHMKILNILKKVQNRFEDAIDNPAEIYSFVIKFSNETGAIANEELTSIEILKILHSIEKLLKSVDVVQNLDNVTLKYEIFDNFLNLPSIKEISAENKTEKFEEYVKNLIREINNVDFLTGGKQKDTLLINDSNTQNKVLVEKSENEENKKSQESLDDKFQKSQNDDIILVEKSSVIEETGIGSVEPVSVEEDFTHLESSNDDLIKKQNTKMKIVSKEKINEEIIKKIDDSDLRLQSPILKPYGVDSPIESPSMLTDFVQSILKSTIPVTPKFDPQILLERIRSNGTYLNFKNKWELFSCKAPSFLQKLYVHGLF
ncbi:uncharacterized protein LOC129605308 [Condylostylus longicornis]|uniref:uncharacterized protein LOC129605308 n=1 Tax=Condylostylus longicornis TaxID=2530218 RepID=UPI00244E1D22|nr:uncharacterized protein LOC129605308 [Condylostylus longicornis]